MSTVTDLFLQIFNILGTCKLQTKLCSFRRSSQEGCQQSTTGLRHWFCLQSYSWKHIETLLTLKLISAFILYANHERREYTTKDFHFEPCHIGSASLLPIIIPVHLKKESHHEWNQNDLCAFQTLWQRWILLLNHSNLLSEASSLSYLILHLIPTENGWLKLLMNFQ